MDREQLRKIVANKIDAALNATDHPKKFFITANGRGVTDGGDLYNALLKDVLNVVGIALADIFGELAEAGARASEKQAASAKTPDKPATTAKAPEKTTKGKK